MWTFKFSADAWERTRTVPSIYKSNILITSSSSGSPSDKKVVHMYLLKFQNVCKSCFGLVSISPSDAEFVTDVKVDLLFPINLESEVRIDQSSGSLVVKILWFDMHSWAGTAQALAHVHVHITSIKFSAIIGWAERCALFNLPLSQHYCRRGSGP